MRTTLIHPFTIPTLRVITLGAACFFTATFTSAFAADIPTSPASTHTPVQPIAKPSLAPASPVTPTPAENLAPSANTDLPTLFTKGNELFRSALEKAKTDRPAAESIFRDAAAAWRTVASQGNIHNARLETNIANASILGNDIPRAIAAYRRAQAIDPLDTDIRSGLAAARRAAGTESLATGAAQPDSTSKSAGGFTGTIKQISAFMQSGAARASLYLPAKFLFLATCTLYLAAFAVAIARATRFNRLPIWLPILLFVLGVFAAAPLIARETAARQTRDAIIIQSNIIARSGPAELYDPAFKEPLRAGLEARIEEVRSGWAKIRLPDGRVAWMPESGLEPV